MLPTTTTPTAAVIFDLDGTLLDTLGDLTASLNAVLARFGHPGHPAERVMRYIGSGAPTLVRRALPEAARDDATVERVNAAFVRRYRQHWADTTRPYPGIPELLDRLADRGVSLGILSNKPHEFTEKTVRKFLGAWPFDQVWGAGPDRALKPDPSQALAIAEALNVNPSATLFVGDSGVDMRTAVNAAMVPVGALWGFRPRQTLERAGAAHLLDQPDQLLPLLP